MSSESTTTICAISTPPGIGGIAVARLSGPQAIAIANHIWRGCDLTQATTHTAHLGLITDPQTGETLDQAVATLFRGPRSFTGDDVVELSIHGSQWIQSELINLLIRQGATLAEPGEFTRRAFASGRLDLAEAEAVADVIASTSRASHRVAMSQMRGNFSRALASLHDQLLNLASLLELELDFSEEEVEFANRTQLLQLSTATLAEIDRLASSFATGNALRQGIPAAIIGEPNAGKSSILNLLLGDNRAIVSDIPGTTRDTIEDTATIGPLTYRFIDTAGLRHTTDPVEALGIERAWQKAATATLILWVIDTTTLTPTYLTSFATQLSAHLPSTTPILPILNKTDLIPAPSTEPSPSPTEASEANSTPTPASHSELLATLRATTLPSLLPPVEFSAATRAALSTLRESISAAARAALPQGAESPDAAIVTNARHYQALLHASSSLRRVVEGLSTTLPSDLIAQDLRETLHHLATITGTITTPDILANIFTRFCIGK